MSRFEFTHEWLSAGNDAPEYRDTTAFLALHIGDLSLTQNEDVWSKTVRETVLVSTYPLAIWLASSWWRLNWEPLPRHGVRPTVDWRMAHEMGASNHGYVWPQVLFASDSETIQIWAVASDAASQQSVRYINGLDTPAAVALPEFQRGVDNFIGAVLNRLGAVNCSKTDLSHLWQLVQEDRADPQSAKYRRLEAEMGYDPDECPELLMQQALLLDGRMGTPALSELAPVYGRSAVEAPLTAIIELADSPGLSGTPEVPRAGEVLPPCVGAPWQRAVAAARAIRESLGNRQGRMADAHLYGLLGLSDAAVEEWVPSTRGDAAIAVPETACEYKFLPRKRHPISRRFEFARFLGDYIRAEPAQEHWLVSTDLSTSRQKYQRAFAAEFLCPIDGLKEFLQDDYSESTIEDAALHFQVSERTVESLLANNGLIPSSLLAGFAGGRLPYRLAN